MRILSFRYLHIFRLITMQRIGYTISLIIMGLEVAQVASGLIMITAEKGFN